MTDKANQKELVKLIKRLRELRRFRREARRLKPVLKAQIDDFDNDIVGAFGVKERNVFRYHRFSAAKVYADHLSFWFRAEAEIAAIEGKIKALEAGGEQSAVTTT